MTPDELRRIFDESRGHYLQREARRQLSWDDIQDLLDVTTLFKGLGRSRPSDPTLEAEMLQGERLVLRASDGTWSITNMGALLFARDLEQFDELKYRRVRVTKFTGPNKINATYDVFERRGYAVAFTELLDLVNSHVETNERIRASLRETVPLYPEVAIREFVANAMIHQDFEQQGIQISIEFFDDRLEITNAGEPIIDVTRFVDESRARNPHLADLMRRMGMCEVRGSGIDRALEQNELYQQPAPVFWTGSRTTKVTLRAHQVFSDMKMEERVWAAFLHCCLRYVSNAQMTNGSLRKRFGLSDEKASMVSQVIGAAVEGGLIKPAPNSGSSKRFSSYVPVFA